MRWAGHVASSKRDRRGSYRILGERDLRGRDNKEDRGVDGRLLQWNFKKWDGEVWNESIWFRVGKGVGHL
jgi:hypothetical protein